MNTKQKIRNITAVLLLVFGLGLVVHPSIANAADKGCGTETAILECKGVDNNSDDVEKSGIWNILIQLVNLLTAGVGVIALAGIVYGSVLYTSAGGNQEQVKKAITVFTNVGIGIIAFAGMWVALNFLIPGGVF